jgi:hypothetical protein
MTIAQHTLTLFNKYQNGLNFIDKHVEIIIPENSETEGKRFLRSFEWIKYPHEEKYLFWTLQIEDVIVLEKRRK